MTALERGKLAAAALTRLKNERIKLHSKKCKKCDADISYEKRRDTFCSKSCAASYNNVGVRRHAGLRKDPIDCGGCGEKTYNEKYCNNKCQRIASHKILLEDFKGGLLVNAQTQFKIIVELRGNKCGGSGCDNDGTWLGQPLKLQVDHVDGDATNNFPHNLRLLCPNCHCQTPNWGMRNKGKGRKSRLK